MGEPRILLFDIENTPNIAYTWGKYDQTVNRFQKEWWMLCFGWKWLGERGVNVEALPDWPGAYKKDPTNDLYLVTRLRDLIDEADVVVAHNGDGFDMPKARARWLVHDIDPPSPVRSVDTLKVARKVAMFNSNKLGDLGETLGLGTKANDGGFDTWLKCMAGDPKAWARMMRYCGRDVLLLEKVYKRLRPYIENHPNVALIGDNKDGCPKCGKGPLIKRGTRKIGLSYVYDRYYCKACRGFSRGRNRVAQSVPNFVN